MRRGKGLLTIKSGRTFKRLRNFATSRISFCRVWSTKVHHWIFSTPANRLAVSEKIKFHVDLLDRLPRSPSTS